MKITKLYDTKMLILVKNRLNLVFLLGESDIGNENCAKSYLDVPSKRRIYMDDGHAERDCREAQSFIKPPSTKLHLVPSSAQENSLGRCTWTI